MKAKHLKTLNAIFETPTRANIVFADLEALIKARGGEVIEREGSRIVFDLDGAIFHAHRPHPGKDAKKYQVEGIRHFLERQGVTPDLIEQEEQDHDYEYHELQGLHRPH